MPEGSFVSNSYGSSLYEALKSAINLMVRSVPLLAVVPEFPSVTHRRYRWLHPPSLGFSHPGVSAVASVSQGRFDRNVTPTNEGAWV